jgi:hypothetical protein
MLYEHSAPLPQPAATAASTRLPRLRVSAAADALALLRVLHGRILAGAPPVPGHAAAARLIGLRPAAAGYVGGLCRRIDRACDEAGLPPLAARWVRTPPRAPAAGVAGAAARARRPADPRRWTEQDFERLRQHLGGPGG